MNTPTKTAEQTAPTDPNAEPIREVGFREVGFREVGFREVGFREGGFREVGFREGGFREGEAPAEPSFSAVHGSAGALPSHSAGALPSYISDSNTETERWELRLYIAGQTPKSVTAFANLKQLCEEHLPGRYQIEVIDLIQQPQLAAGDQIVAIPTLVRKLPEPLRRIVGDLSNTERTLVGLQLRPAQPGK